MRRRANARPVRPWQPQGASLASRWLGRRKFGLIPNVRYRPIAVIQKSMSWTRRFTGTVIGRNRSRIDHGRRDWLRSLGLGQYEAATVGIFAPHPVLSGGDRPCGETIAASC